jgi:hypothetical protein
MNIKITNLKFINPLISYKLNIIFLNLSIRLLYIVDFFIDDISYYYEVYCRFF